MSTLRGLLAGDGPLLVPAAHDALTARLIEAAGFTAYGVGGASLSATQLALPDVGLQSFGEYRDGVARIMEGAARLPVMVDGENGFGDAKAVTRTVRTFEAMGVGALAFEDLVFPPMLSRPPGLITRAEMDGKLTAALAARRSEEMLIIGRTDAAHVAGLDEALIRARGFESLGVDAVLAPGLADLDAYKRLRDAVSVPLVAVVVAGSPWFAPSVEQLRSVGVQAALYPAAILIRVAGAIREGIDAIRSGDLTAPSGFGFRDLAEALRTSDWAAVDAAGMPGASA